MIQLPYPEGRALSILSTEGWVGSLTEIFALKMEAAGFCEMFSPIYQTTQRHIPDDRN